MASEHCNVAHRVAVARTALWAGAPPLPRSCTPPANVLSPWTLLLDGPVALVNSTPETTFRQHLLPRLPRSPRMLFIDVGGADGTFARGGFARGHDGLALEAAPANCPSLERAANNARQRAERKSKALFYFLSAKNKLVALCAAAGAEPGELFMAGRSNASRGDDFSLSQSSRGKVRVPVVRLDAAVEQNFARRPIVLKTDTQGFEMSVLRGAGSLLSQGRVRLLFVEMSSGTLRAHGSSPAQLMGFLHDHGYDCTHLGISAARRRPRGFYYVSRTFPAVVAALDVHETVEFGALDAFLARVPPDKLSGWTDLLCWPWRG